MIPLTTFTPSNHDLALLYPLVIAKHIHMECTLERYTGPFSKTQLEHLIGPFRSSPLGTVKEPGSLDEFQVIQDFSYPQNHATSSVNSEINMDEFTCNWGTFQNIINIIVEAPPFTKAATLDVDAAYRRCIHPSQQQHFVVM